jgi:hypothetical protein
MRYNHFPRLNFAVVAVMICMTLTLSGCSNKLTRSQAEKMIQAKIPIGFAQPESLASASLDEPVPGYSLPEDDYASAGIFHLQKANGFDDQSDDENSLDLALAQIGYVTYESGGPVTSEYEGTKIPYSHSRTVQFTTKVGPMQDDDSHYYSSGFHCYPPPLFTQCETPPLIETLGSFKVTGITQDESRAKVDILIDWKLTDFGSQLKPFATNPSGEAPNWAQFLDAHNLTGSSPATILFQRYDDGWRIVDANGNSESRK